MDFHGLYKREFPKIVKMGQKNSINLSNTIRVFYARLI